MRQMVFANIFVEGWTIYPNVYSFFEEEAIKEAIYIRVNSPSHGNNICHYWKINGKSLKINIIKLFRHTFSNTN